LSTQFVTVADKQRPTQLPGVGDLLEEVDSMKVLPAPVASERSARFGSPCTSQRAIFSSTARMAASW
jgi:hypothetical protein